MNHNETFVNKTIKKKTNNNSISLYFLSVAFGWYEHASQQ